MKKTIIAISITALSIMPSQAHAFSLKKLFKVSLASVFNPFHIVYKLNIITGSKPTTFIPNFALRDEDRQWKYNYNTNDWDRYSWDNNPQIQPPLYPPEIRPVPPPVIVNPPCQRGGTGITPC